MEPNRSAVDLLLGATYSVDAHTWTRAEPPLTEAEREALAAATAEDLEAALSVLYERMRVDVNVAGVAVIAGSHLNTFPSTARTLDTRMRRVTADVQVLEAKIQGLEARHAELVGRADPPGVMSRQARRIWAFITQ